MQIHRPALALAAVTGLLFSLGAGPATAGDPCAGSFICEIEAAVPIGRAHAHRLEAGTGFANGVDVSANGLALQLAFRSLWWNARGRSYPDLEPAEEARVDRMLIRLVEDDPALRGEPLVDPALTGTALMGLSQFLSSGGPAQVEGIDLFEALRSGALALAAARIQGPDPAEGGWRTADGRVDVVVTMLAAVGIDMAMNILDGLPDVMPAAGAFVARRVNPDGGHGDGASGPAETAGGHLLATRGGLDHSGPVIQGQLGWLLDRHPLIYTPERSGHGLHTWALMRALIWGDGREGRGDISIYDFETLDPMGMGYLDLVRYYRFDLDWALLQGWHPEHGPWQSADDNRIDGFYALLALTVPWGVLDIDHDGDGLLSIDDNCPRTANAAQEDADWDDVGDACDNCPDIPNPDQEDADEDGIGDACQPADGPDAMPDMGPDAMSDPLDATADATMDASIGASSDASPDAVDGMVPLPDGAPDAAGSADADGPPESPHLPRSGCAAGAVAGAATGDGPTRLALLGLLVLSARVRRWRAGRAGRGAGRDRRTAACQPNA